MEVGTRVRRGRLTGTVVKSWKGNDAGVNAYGQWAVPVRWDSGRTVFNEAAALTPISADTPRSE